LPLCNLKIKIKPTPLQGTRKNKTKKKNLYSSSLPHLEVAIERKKSLELACPMQTSTKKLKNKMLQSPGQL